MRQGYGCYVYLNIPAQDEMLVTVQMIDQMLKNLSLKKLCRTLYSCIQVLDPWEA